jgi:hypothetical protein
VWAAHDDAFTRGDELLREQRAETTGGFDRPGARLERCRKPQQSVALPTIRAHAQLTDEFLRIVEHRRGVRPLVRIDPDHEHHFLLHADRRGMPRRAVLMKGDCSPLSGHAAARTQPAVTSLKSHQRWQGILETAGQALERYEHARNACTRSSIRANMRSMAAADCNTADGRSRCRSGGSTTNVTVPECDLVICHLGEETGHLGACVADKFVIVHSPTAFRARVELSLAHSECQLPNDLLIVE